ncbi:unnamed protein product, partial [Polarella glacialis]
MASTTLQVHIIEALDVKSSGSFLLRSNDLYVGVKLDGYSCGKSASVATASSGHIRWDFRVEVTCTAASENLEIEVKRSSLLSDKHIGGCLLPVSQLDHVDQHIFPLWDSSRKEVGRIRVSIFRSEPGTHSVQGGLVNRVSLSTAGTKSLVSPSSFSGPDGRLSLQSQGSSSLSESRQGGAGGLTNYSGAASSSFSESHQGGAGGLTNYSGAASSSAGQPSVSAGLTNYAPSGTADLSQSSSANPERGSLQPSFCRAGTSGGLANLASVNEDGTRPNALRRAEELLSELLAGGGLNHSRGGDEHRQKLTQVVENLRHATASELEGAGRNTVNATAQLIKAAFEDALGRGSEKDANGALWLAGRLPDDSEVTLQAQLRTSWDENKMTEAFQRATELLPSASAGGNGLEEFMDALELAEFHSNRIQQDIAAALSELLAELRPGLALVVRKWLQDGNLSQVEHTLGILGAARVDTLGLRGIQQELQRLRGVELLQAALLPGAGQIGFPELKKRQLRHAVMTIRAALADDSSGNAVAAVRKLLIEELLPKCIHHSNGSTGWGIRTAVELHLPNDEVWDAVHAIYQSLPGERKQGLSSSLPQLCRELGRDVPEWLLTPQQAACQDALRSALLREGNASALQAACQKVMETPGGSEACQEEMRQAITRLRTSFRLPAAWDVESMFAGDKLLAKNEITDRSLLAVFDNLVKQTAEPDVRTRDRRGGVPRSFTAVRAVQVMNAASWASYLQRRDEIVTQCQDLGARHDAAHWRENLNGDLLCKSFLKDTGVDLTSDTPLAPEANECWLLHGTSHAAAEGITSEDFDMTRSSPSGLFGAGLYFGESASKSDEYVEGKLMGGQELFPLLLCRVTLGYIYYCDTRYPD